MKKYLLVISFLFSLVQSHGQITLDSCRSAAKQNYPILKQSALFEQITALKIDKLQSNYLPQFTLNAQASLQSEVTSIVLPQALIDMGFNLEPVSKDQYKMYIDLKQNIWDGGLTKANEALENSMLKANQSQLEANLYQLNFSVDAYFFGILQYEQQLNVLDLHKNNLTDSYQKAQAAYERGTLKKINVELLNVEVLKLDQQIITTKAKCEGLKRALSVLTGLDLTSNIEFETPTTSIATNTQNIRPELSLMSANQTQIEISNNLLQTARNPKIFGFGQLGYGRPGFNMLNNSFSPFGIIGVGASWQISDWKSTQRNIKINQLQQSIIETKKEDFIQQNTSKQVELLAQIESLGALLSSDLEIIELQSSILSRSETEFENGTISTNDFLKAQNALSIAKLNYAAHKLQKTQLVTSYNLLQGL